MSDFFSDALIDEIRSANDIVDVVSEYVQLEKRGKDFFGLCPFHREKTPSFSVIPGKQIFYCFGCNKGGNVLHFVMNLERLDFKEAIKSLANRAKITLPDSNSALDEKEALLKKQIAEINREAARFFYNTLVSDEGEISRNYLSNRKISEKTTRRFGLGYAPNDWDKLHKELQSKGFSAEALQKSGLFSQNKNGGYFDKFRHRLMFPIFNITGSVIAFGGRLIDDTEGPKYMNSPETLVYSKGRHLYALNFAKASQAKQLFIVEGYMDVIAMHQSGFTNTVASLGTALTDNQAKILKKYSDELIICYDSDTAGQAATIRGLDILKSIGCSVKVLTITDAKDPDEYIRKNGVEAFKRIAAKAVSLVEYKVLRLKETYQDDSIDSKMNMIVEIANILCQVDTSAEREMYIKKFAKEYDISENALLELIDTKLGRVPNAGLGKKTSGLRSQHSQSSSENKTLSRAIYNERMLLVFLCTDNTTYNLVKTAFSETDFSSDENIDLARTIFNALDSNIKFEFNNLIDRISPDNAGIFSAMAQKDCSMEDTHSAVKCKIKDIMNDHLDLKIEEIRETMGITQDDESLKELMETFNELMKKRKAKI